MRRPLNFLSVLLVSSFTHPYTVSSEGTQGTGDVSPATPSYDHPLEQGNRRYVVTVAQVAHSFSPLSVNASIGDIITFKFYPTTHSVTLADYSGPCVPWSHAHPGQPDVWSGLITETESRPNPQSWTYLVDTKDPRFFYCSAPDSCTVWGMVFAVNPSSTETIEGFKQAAYVANFAMSPGQTAPPEGPTSSTPSAGDATPSSSTPSAGNATPSSSKGLSKGAIIGIVLGVISAVTLVGIIFFLIGRSRRKSDAEKKMTTASVAKPVVGAAPANQPYPLPKQEHGEGSEELEAKSPVLPARPLSLVNPYFYPHAAMYGSPAHPHYIPHAFGYGSPPRPLSPHYNPHAAMYGSPPSPLGPINPNYNPHAAMFGSPPHPLSSTHSHYNPHASMSGSPPLVNPNAPLAPAERVRENESQPTRVESSMPGVDNRASLNKPPDNP